MKARIVTLVIVIAILSTGFAFPQEAQASDTICHTVRPGETVASIAAYYGVSASAIIQANNLWNPNLIYSGQCLLIPLPSRPSPPCTTIHVVRRGEYLKIIAPRYGVSVSAIVNANGLKNPNLIYPGQRLIIPCGTAPPPAPKPTPEPGCTKIHVVKRGEYLKVIARRYGVSVSAIVNANGLKNPNLIYPGQRLKIPCKSTSPKPTPAPSPKGPWTGQYWNNRFLSGYPTFTRQDQAVNFSWGRKGPSGGIGGTNFSVRWTQTKHFAGGRYRFNVTVDDGVRVWVDGQLIIDRWHDTAPQTYSAVRDLATGNHTIQIDYYQNQGGAQIKFWSKRVDVPAAWKGEFFNNTNLSGMPAVTKSYPAINFNWGRKAPVHGITADYFSARFTTESYFSEGRYRFVSTMDDGMRIYLDDRLILDQWQLGSARTFVSEVLVSQGNHRVRVEYFENTGDAVCKLHWQKK
jgi:LysM repeat protein